MAAATAFACAVAVAVFAWPSPPASAADTLRRAVNATVAAGSATVSFSAAVSGPSGSTASTGSGTVSFLNAEANFTLGDSPAFPGGADLRITSDGIFLRAPALLGTLLGEGKEWIKWPALPRPADTTTTTSSTTTTTTTTTAAPPTTAASIVHAIEVLRSQGMIVDEAGVAVVNGVDTDAYNFQDPDASDALAGTAYVAQDSGQLTRLDINTAKPTGETGQLTIDMTKSAGAVDVPAPPIETTVDIATVLAPKQ